jgi:hypothetical protein
LLDITERVLPKFVGNQCLENFKNISEASPNDDPTALHRYFLKDANKLKI